MGGFLVLRRQAEGAAADVFLACDERIGANVILEVMRPAVARDDAAYGRFLDQARRRRVLSHPALVRINETLCRADGAVLAVTEPVSGQDLREWVQAHGPLSPRDVERLVGPLCEALDYLHRRGVVQGTLSPDWVFVEGPKDAPQVRLLEAGLALLRVGVAVAPPSPQVLVPVDYLSPERVRGYRASPASDIYGLGVLMYELLTGAPPFRRRDADDTRRAHVEALPPPLPATAAALWPVVSRCLEKDPARRFPDALLVRDALVEALATATVDERRRPPAPPPAAAVAPRVAAWRAALKAPGELALGPWVLEVPVGEGGMGRVWLAHHRATGRKAAVKVLKRNWLEDPEQVRRFLREARIMGRIRHPNVAEVLDCGQEPLEAGGDVWMALELLRGEALSKLARPRPLPLVRSLELVRQACLGIGAAHDLGAVHRDVKPDNLFVCAGDDGADRVKVVDFGVARLTGPLLSTQERTREGIVVGTPSYMAPEQAVGEPAGPRADVYALGTVLYALVAGRLPFDGRTSDEVLANRLMGKPHRLPAYTPSGEVVPKALWPVVARTLVKDPAHRTVSMEALHDELVPILERLRAQQAS